MRGATGLLFGSTVETTIDSHPQVASAPILTASVLEEKDKLTNAHKGNDGRKHTRRGSRGRGVSLERLDGVPGGEVDELLELVEGPLDRCGAQVGLDAEGGGRGRGRGGGFSGFFDGLLDGEGLEGKGVRLVFRGSDVKLNGGEEVSGKREEGRTGQGRD